MYVGCSIFLLANWELQYNITCMVYMKMLLPDFLFCVWLPQILMDSISIFHRLGSFDQKAHLLEPLEPEGLFHFLLITSVHMHKYEFFILLKDIFPKGLTKTESAVFTSNFSTESPFALIFQARVVQPITNKPKYQSSYMYQLLLVQLQMETFLFYRLYFCADTHI